MKLGDAMFESDYVFLWTLVSDKGDWNNAKFTVGGDFLFVVFVEAYNFSDLISCAGGIDRIKSGVYGWRKWVSVDERIKIWCSEYHSEET